MPIFSPFQVLTLVLFIIACSLNGSASAQSPVGYSFSDFSFGEIVPGMGDQAHVVGSKYPAGVTLQACPQDESPRSCRLLSHPKAPPITMSQRYPYSAFQMSYYARPYNASYNTLANAPSYSSDVFRAAQQEVESNLPPDTNLEYAGSARNGWPLR